MKISSIGRIVSLLDSLYRVKSERKRLKEQFYYLTV
jgi:hypothetical protein